MADGIRQGHPLITIGPWLFWNQIPVTLGNVVGGALLTGLLLHYAHQHTAGAATDTRPRACRLDEAADPGVRSALPLKMYF